MYCSKCQCFMSCDKNGYIIGTSPTNHNEKMAGDEYVCTVCGSRVVTGLGRKHDHPGPVDGQIAMSTRPGLPRMSIERSGNGNVCIVVEVPAGDVLDVVHQMLAKAGTGLMLEGLLKVPQHKRSTLCDAFVTWGKIMSDAERALSDDET